MSKSKNTNLHQAKASKNDEFYTQIEDIERELVHYRNHFKDKVILCNCDDPEWSNFWKYFHFNFESLGLKKLISTYYDAENPSYKMVYEGGYDNDTSVGEKIPLTQNGDFRSPECVETLKEADIVVTNPPFSLFRKYVAILMEHNKEFLIIGNKNACNYLVPLIKLNKIWLGINSPSVFNTPNGMTKNISGLCRWFTNLDYPKRHENLNLVEHYSSDKYPKFDNYDAINVDKVSNIPCDYDEVMGVPITFLDKYNPEQFKILGITYSTDKNKDIEKLRTDAKHRHVGIINGKEKYPRILIVHRK